MSEADREKWEQRYADGSYEGRSHPSSLLTEWLEKLPRRDGARALDLACGAGRNALTLAARGYRVEAMDISTTALARAEARAAEMGVVVDWIAVDLDEVEVARDRYDLILVVRYVNHALNASLIAALRDGGHLIYEQHLQSDHDVGGPSSERFRMRPNELREMFTELNVLDYREGLTKDPDGRTMALAQLVACKDPGD